VAPASSPPAHHQQQKNTPHAHRDETSKVVTIKEGIPMPREEFEELFVQGRSDGKLIQPVRRWIWWNE
jgi:hypothetical protein